MSAVIECPACHTRYKMGKPIPEGGRNVKCARCAHQWRLLPEKPEEEAEALTFEQIAPVEAETPAYTQSSEAAEEPSVAERRSWDIRRDNFAAAMAALGEPPSAETQDEAQPAAASPGQTQSWLGDGDAYSRGETAEGETASSEDGDIAVYRSDPEPSVSRWGDDSDWMNQQTGDAGQETGGNDPEESVRRALKAALEDRDESESETASHSNRFMGPMYSPETFGSASNETEAASDQDDAFHLASDTAAETSGALEDGSRFETDIAGVFRQDGQPKRSFARPAAARRQDENGFTDYDAQSGGPAGSSSEIYSADSPLDADAAALQAVLEGSLRERHVEDSRSGGGGLALAAAWAVFLSVLSGVTLALVTFRDEMVTALPGTAALYRSVGLSVQDRQIDFGPVTYRWTLSEGKPMIEVTGQVINLTDHEITVPRVLINVRDAESSDPVKATATLRSEPLAARETADFTLEFLAPPKSVTQIELAFANED